VQPPRAASSGAPHLDAAPGMKQMLHKITDKVELALCKHGAFLSAGAGSVIHVCSCVVKQVMRYTVSWGWSESICRRAEDKVCSWFCVVSITARALVSHAGAGTRAPAPTVSPPGSLNP
jgi:hypothetical protein